MYYGRIIGIIESEDYAKRAYSFKEKHESMKKFVMNKWCPYNNGHRSPTENDKYRLHVQKYPNNSTCYNVIIKNMDEVELIQKAPYTDFVFQCKALYVVETIDRVYSNSKTELMNDLEYLYDELITNEYIQSKYPLGIAISIDQ